MGNSVDSVLLFEKTKSLSTDFVNSVFNIFSQGGFTPLVPETNKVNVWNLDNTKEPIKRLTLQQTIQVCSKEYTMLQMWKKENDSFGF